MSYRIRWLAIGQCPGEGLLAVYCMGNSIAIPLDEAYNGPVNEAVMWTSMLTASVGRQSETLVSAFGDSPAVLIRAVRVGRLKYGPKPIILLSTFLNSLAAGGRSRSW